jgi:hypothetical protein
VRLFIFSEVLADQQPHLSSESSQFEFRIQEGIPVVKYSCFLKLLERILGYRNYIGYKFQTKAKMRNVEYFCPKLLWETRQMK